MSRAVVLPSGQILDGRYRVDDPIGEGGFATVYAGMHLGFGLRVAIKALHIDDGGDPEREADRFADFIDEGKLVTRLRHDHIVRTLDQGIFRPAGGGRAVPYLVLEWCGEESLEGRLRRDAKMSLAEAYAIVHAVSLAMAHAHEASVVHRDIKPGNVMLAHGANGELVPRVIDFGVAKVFEDGAPDSRPTVTRSAGKFTPAYAAPEQLASVRSGPYTDVHAIGLLFYELTTGRKPFAQSTLGSVDPERPTPARVGVDVGAFEPVIAKAVALKPADRYPDARALVSALEEAARATDLAKALPVVAAIASPFDTLPPPTSHTANGPNAPIVSRRSPWLAAALLAAVLVFSGLYAFRARGPASVAAQQPIPEQPTPSSSPKVVASVPSEKIVITATAAPIASPSMTELPKKQVAPPTKSAEKATKVEVSSVPSASISKGVGGIVEKPPF